MHCPCRCSCRRVWEIVRIVRKIAQYFYPQRQTQVMNEGWATFWHYTLMNDLYDEGFEFSLAVGVDGVVEVELFFGEVVAADLDDFGGETEVFFALVLGSAEHDVLEEELDALEGDEAGAGVALALDGLEEAVVEVAGVRHWGMAAAVAPAVVAESPVEVFARAFAAVVVGEGVNLEEAE